ncbi:insulin gene enhancer protein ISL-2 isoform X2 [Xenopus laevis]|uniref:Insulin gene enhancer protein ISL-2 isoform X2 n=1 Tax=Xenopus laevis TaxID=8355 RepID=A0A8J0UQM6_XENLA|nr:insulin gene enhancer protein ISL-2 isoform X2 [Xenopus laevis]
MSSCPARSWLLWENIPKRRPVWPCVWAVAATSSISTSSEWPPTWSGTRPVSSAPSAVSTWMRTARALCETARLTARGTISDSGRPSSLRSHIHKQTEKTTRVRTVLNEKQLHTLRTCYGANPRPDALMKEQLVEMTGLSPRVIRVWFQNKRCKDKKRSIFMKQLQQQQLSDKTSLQGLTGTPMVAGSPIRHDSAVQGSAVEVQTYQPPWKALSDFALQSDLDQPAFQQLVSFSESGSLGNSSGSDIASLSSQLPDTPNSMVPSPVET